MSDPAPLSVAVLVELERTPHSGGHVKCWERLAAAAAGRDDVDLTVYVLGDAVADDALAANVRFTTLRPALSGARVQRLVGGVDMSDLAPFHAGLARRLPGHRVWHATHCLSFAGTALAMRRRYDRALVGSVHTDVPLLTRIYTRQVISDLPAGVRRPLTRLGLDRAAGALATWRRDRILRGCAQLLASNDADERELRAVAPDARVGRLRRGVDTAMFHPDPDAYRALSTRFGVPADEPRVLFAGRVDATKGAPLVAEAIRRLRGAGTPAHLVVAGTGAAEASLTALLGPSVTLLGHLPQRELATAYAGCDALAFPSRSETAGNVVPEAMAAGLPPVLPAGSRTQQWLRVPGEDGLLVADDDPASWTAALGMLLADPDRRRAMGAAARRTVEATCPAWGDVLEQDLLPVWRAAAAAPSADRSPAAATARA